MIIKELNLIGFGKFENKIINLKEGINIIYGENEKGKTTLHNFIDGMFYGFLRPYVKTTRYLDEHGKYMPWNSMKYSGIIKFEQDGEIYTIERDFSRGNERTKVILDSTGEDITHSIDNGDRGRILQPGFHFFGFNDAVYTNTVSIKQLGIKTEDKLANELRDKLVNIANTLDEDISIENSINDLNKALKDIGTSRAPTSIYGIAQNNLVKLKSEKEEVLEYKNDYEVLLEENISIDRELEKYYNNIKLVENRLEKARIIEKQQVYNEGKDLYLKIEDLEDKAKELKIYNPLSMEDYTQGIRLNNSLTYLDSDITSTRDSIKELESKIENIDINTDDLEENRDIIHDYESYEELDEEKHELLYSKDNNLEFLKRDFKANDKIKSNYTLGLLVSFISSVGILFYSFISKNFGPGIISLFLFSMMIYSIVKLRRLNGLLKRIHTQIVDLESLENKKRSRIDKIEELQKEILNKYNMSSKLDFKRLKESIQYNFNKGKERAIQLKEYIEKKDSEIEKLKNYVREKEETLKNLKDLLIKNKSNDLEEFKRGLEKKKIYEEVVLDLNSKRDLYKRIMGNSSLEDLLNELEQYGDYENLIEDRSINDLEKLLVDIKEESTKIRIHKSAIEEKLNTLNQKILRLVEIDEEIERLNFKLKELDHNRDAIQLAKDTIEIISKDIHRQFAPAINKKVGNVIEDITGGKYKEVRIDNKLEIGLINPITGEIININSLSGGTIDQLYFALRFGIIKSMAEHRLPLILDDCFIQYDDLRLENIMKFLSEKGKERQIILFSCQRREKEILQKINENFNLITL